MQRKEILHKSPSKIVYKWNSQLVPETALTQFTLYVTHIASLWVRNSY